MKDKQVKFEVIPDDEIFECDIVVCVLAGNGPPVFPDNVFDFCSKCGEKVQLRPHVPPGPKRICMHCVDKYMLEEGDGNVTVRTSSTTIKELRKMWGRIRNES